MSADHAAQFSDLVPEDDVVGARLVADLRALYTAPALPASLRGGIQVERRADARRVLSRRALLLLVAATLGVIALGGAISGFLALWNADPGAAQLERSGAVRQIGTVQTVGGASVRLERAYADMNRVIVGLTAMSDSGARRAEILAATLRDERGGRLGDLGSLQAGDPAAKLGALVLFFDASAIPEGTTQATFELSIDAVRLDDRLVDGPWTFRFTLPVAAGRIASPHASASALGRTMTLDRVVVTPSATRAFYHIEPAPGFLLGWVPNAWIEIAGKRMSGLQHCDADGSCSLMITEPLFDQHGTWTLRVEEHVPGTGPGSTFTTRGPWTVAFVVP